MTICPIAIAVGCKKCPIFKICPVKSVLGDVPKTPTTKPVAAASAKTRSKNATKPVSKAAPKAAAKATTKAATRRKKSS